MLKVLKPKEGCAALASPDDLLHSFTVTFVRGDFASFSSNSAWYLRQKVIVARNYSVDGTACLETDVAIGQSR